MPLKTNELNAAIKYWRTKKKWPQDFHSDLYDELADFQEKHLFDDEWWDFITMHLRRWRATRGGNDGINDMDRMKARARERYSEMSYVWHSEVMPAYDQEFETIEWESLACFTDIVREIKVLKTPSPVFESKLCHMLAPHLFPVIDKGAMDLPFKKYSDYYNAAKKEWLETEIDVRDELIEILKDEIGSAFSQIYPIKCKVIELCYMGRNQMKNGEHCK